MYFICYYISTASLVGTQMMNEGEQKEQNDIGVRKPSSRYDVPGKIKMLLRKHIIIIILARNEMCRNRNGTGSSVHTHKTFVLICSISIPQANMYD